MEEEEPSSSSSAEEKLNALLILNKAYQEVIAERLGELNRRLQLNLHQQNEITLKLRRNMKARVATTSTSTASKESNTVGADLSRIKGSYFMDRYGSEPDANSVSTQMRRHFVYFNYVPQFKSEWTLEFRRKLKQSVVADTLRLIRTPHQSKIKLLEEKFYTYRAAKRKRDEDNGDDNSDGPRIEKKDINAVQKMLKEANSQLTRLELMSEDQILKQVDVDKVDWLKIAKVDLNGNWSATECRLVWTNVCNPAINQSKWTPTETNQLVELARKHREKNWHVVSLELNTNRSPFLCMKRYHEKTALKYCKRDWTEEEVKKLIEHAEMHRIGFYVPYNYLCYLNGTRDRTSVYNCHLKRDPYLMHGKWSVEEKRMFDEAICFFAERNWQEISEYVGTRTAMQCKERYENKFMNPEKYKEWTREEDALLLAACEQHDKQWSKIAAALFPERTDHALLFRYNKLAAWREQNDWFNSLSPRCQDFVMLLHGKEKNSETSDTTPIDNGQPMVPRPPKFLVASQNFQSLQQLVEEKKDTIDEFQAKMEEEQKLNTLLLASMGLPAKLINRVAGRFKRKVKRKYKGEYIVVSPLSSSSLNSPNHITTSPSMTTTSSIKERLKERVVRVSNNNNKKTGRRSSENTTATVVKKRAKSLKINEYKNGSVRTESRTIKEILQATASSSDTLLLASNSIGSIIGSSNSTTPTLTTAVNVVSASISTSQIERRGASESVTKKSTAKRVAVKTSSSIKRASKKVCTEANKINTIRPLVEQTSSNLNILPTPPPLSLPIIPPPVADVATPITTNQTNEKLIVDLNSIEDGTKIPCLNEMAKEFKYLYSLKVDKSKPETSKYFQKHKIVKIKDQLLVAVKPMNANTVGEYFNETRLELIEKALKKVKLME